MSAERKVYLEPMKAEALNTSQLDLWLQGKRSRRVLVVPFSGPLPGGKAGLDLDGEYFDEDTDLVGGFPILAKTRERLVDWHHDQDPTGVMKGAILGRVVMDAAPEADGLWADFWVNAGEKRKALIATLEYAQVTEVFCQLGERSLSAEQVAKRLVDKVRAYQRSTGALGPHLADQWMLPLALAVWRSGQAASYTCSEVTQHTDTNAQTIAMGLPVRVQITPAAGAMRVEVSPLP